MATPHGESGTGSRQPTVKISIEHYVPETRYKFNYKKVYPGCLGSMIYVHVDSPNLGFLYLNFLGGHQ